MWDSVCTFRTLGTRLAHVHELLTGAIKANKPKISRKGSNLEASSFRKSVGKSSIKPVGVSILVE